MSALRCVLVVTLLTLTFSSLPASPPKAPVAQTNIVLKSLDLVDHRGRRWSADDLKDHRLVVVAFLGTECPLAKLYSNRLNEIASRYDNQDVAVIGVISNRQDSLAEIQAFTDRQEIDFPVLKDAGNKFADQVTAERTPEVFMFDDKRQLRYRGRIDDQYGIGYIRDQPERHDLTIAIDELLAGGEVSVPRTEAVGCIIGRQRKVDADAEITYGSHIASILNQHCVQCHREGEIAPFALTEPSEVEGWADMIAEVVRDGRMPPWHAVTDPKSKIAVEFANDRSMPDRDKEAIYAWVRAGAPLGSTDNLPTPSDTVDGWQLPRTPDHVFDISPDPINVPATGTVRYKYYSVDPGFDEDVWIQAAELQPGNREVVHHILAFAVPKGQRRGLDGARGFLVGYVPGARVELSPPGHAKRIPAGSELVFQVHYTPIGSPQTDQSRLGIVITKSEDVTHEIVTNSAVNTQFRIPAGVPDHQVTASGPPFPPAAKLLSFSPHMHVRGKSFQYQWQTRDGKREELFAIPDYDFNWQTTYVLKEPLAVGQGDRLFCTATFDNSKENLSNPDPSVDVTWGDQTWDEMMIGYFHYSVPKEPESAVRKKESAEVILRRAIRLAKYDELDTDGDQKLNRRDAPWSIRGVFDELDVNSDQVLTREEAGQ